MDMGMPAAEEDEVLSDRRALLTMPECRPEDERRRGAVVFEFPGRRENTAKKRIQAPLETDS